MGPPSPGHSVRSPLLRTDFPVVLLIEGMKVAVHVTGTVHSPVQLNSYWEERLVAPDGIFKSPSCKFECITALNSDESLRALLINNY